MDIFLTKYFYSSVKELPINFFGIVWQIDKALLAYAELLASEGKDWQKVGGIVTIADEYSKILLEGWRLGNKNLLMQNHAKFSLPASGWKISLFGMTAEENAAVLFFGLSISHSLKRRDARKNLNKTEFELLKKIEAKDKEIAWNVSTEGYTVPEKFRHLL